jgi:hypothetical protein
MAKKREASAVLPKHAYRARNRAFQPTRAQRAFVAVAAGLGVPVRVICQMLPTGRAGEAPPLNGVGLRSNFKTELREGLRLADALVEARVYQRALSRDDGAGFSAQALILNRRGGWKSAENRSLPDMADPPLAMDRLSREERDTMRMLLAKATEPAGAEDSEIGAASADGDSRRRKRRHGNLSSR